MPLLRHDVKQSPVFGGIIPAKLNQTAKLNQNRYEQDDHLENEGCQYLMSDQEVIALLDALQNHTSVGLRCPSRNLVYQTIIEGFDVHSRHILLASPHPQLDQARIDLQDVFFEVEYDEGWLVFPAKLRFERQSDANGLINIEVGKSRYSTTRRWSNRIHFNFGKGPEVRVQIENYPAMRGRLANLSQHGARFDFLSMDLSTTIAQHQKVNIELKFNDRFTLNTPARIQSSHFKRSPCLHSQIRAKFNLQDELQRHQLQRFVDTFTELLKLAV